MLELLFLVGLVGAIVLFPLLLIGLVLKLVFRLILIPFEILGALIGAGIVGLVLVVLGIVFGVVLGGLTLAGLFLSVLPLALVGLAVWVLVRLIRGKKSTQPVS